MKIRFNLMPSYVMDVLETSTCEGGEDHAMYRVIDPEGNEDWVCGNDVTVIEP